jgi:hypothetical protein
MTVTNPPIFLQAGSHPAEDVRRFIATITGDAEGVIGSGDLLISEKAGTPDMSVDSAIGRPVVKGTEATFQGTYFCESRSVENLTISASDPTNDRWDLVVAKVEDSDYSGATDAWSLAVVTGTPAGSPADPTQPDNSILLARVVVGNGVTSILDAAITDLRFRFILPGTAFASASDLPASTATGARVWVTDKAREYTFNGTNWIITGGVFPHLHTISPTKAIPSGGGGTNLNYSGGTVIEDTDSITSANAGQIPSGLGGDWLLECGGRFAGNATGVRANWITIASNTTNGEGDDTYGDANPPPSTLGGYVTSSKIFRMEAGAKFTHKVYQTSGGNLNFETGYFTMTMVRHIPTLT